MRQWIREHPWRLEIVPALLFALAAALPFLRRDEVVSGILWFNRLTSGQVWAICYAERLAWMLICWEASSLQVHQWVKDERAKRFNYWAVLLCLVSVIGSLGVGLVGRYGIVGSATPVWLLSGLFLCCVQILIEGSRPFVPRQKAEKRAAVPELRPGEKLYYREVMTNWLLVAHWATWALFIGLQFWGLTAVWWTGLLPFALPIWLSRISRQSFILTSYWVDYRRMKAGTVVWLNEVRVCRVGDYDRLSDVYGDRWTLNRVVSGMLEKTSALVLECDAGVHYVPGLRDPEAVCALVNAAIAARQRKEEAKR